MSETLEIRPEFNSGTIKRIKARVAKDHPGWTDEQIHDSIGEQWFRDHVTCVKSAYSEAKRLLEVQMKPLFLFFLGARGYTRYKARFATLWHDKKSQPDHKYYRPWYHTAYHHFNCSMTWDPAQSTSMAEIDIAKRRVKLNFDCSGYWCLNADCHDRISVDMALGVAMKMAVGGMKRAEWNAFLDKSPGLQVSHVNGVSADCNPLNYNMEPQPVNLSRKPCHKIDYVMAHPNEPFCRNHHVKCHLQSLRMQKNWPLIIGKMIELGNAQRPAIEAYESNIDFMM